MYSQNGKIILIFQKFLKFFNKTANKQPEKFHNNQTPSICFSSVEFYSSVFFFNEDIDLTLDRFMGRNKLK
jgi:hypothetical protein